MDYEKKYKEALELARDYHEDKNCFKYLKGVIENIFPELKERMKGIKTMRFRKGNIITNGKIEYEIRDIQKNQLGDWVYILYNDNIARLLSNGLHLPDGSIRWICEQVDGEFELKQSDNNINWR